MILTEPFTISEIFYDLFTMPCCGKFRLFLFGPRGGLSQNITCAHCNQKFEICSRTHYIKKI